jgi:GNAT superfamily N-acetyltransferase
MRQATPDDVEFVVGLDAMVPGTPRAEAWYRLQIEAGNCTLARVDGQRVAYAIVHRGFFRRDFLSMLVVDPEFRRRGIARALFEHAERRCSGDVFTSTNESNLRMQKVLERLGYERSGHIDNIDPGDRELIYYKRVKKREDA